VGKSGFWCKGDAMICCVGNILGGADGEGYWDRRFFEGARGEEVCIFCGIKSIFGLLFGQLYLPSLGIILSMKFLMIGTL
jgi:hypothetical protein